MPRKGAPKKRGRIKKKSAAAERRAVTAPQLPRRAKEIKIVGVNEVWSEYRLENGTTIKIRPVVTDVFYVKGQFTPEGEPLYLVRGGMTVSSSSPPRLRQKARR